jgi:hypothetical protein
MQAYHHRPYGGVYRVGAQTRVPVPDGRANDKMIRAQTAACGGRNEPTRIASGLLL